MDGPIFDRKVNEPLRRRSQGYSKVASGDLRWHQAACAGIRRPNGSDLNDLIDFFAGKSI